MTTFFRHKGFSLIEMLIVIVLMTIISGAMMMSITQVSTSAEAKNVIRNLQLLKTAVILWYKDNSDKINNENTTNQLKPTAGNSYDVGSHLKIWNKTKYETKQLQQFKGEELGIYKYLDGGPNLIINEHNPPQAGEYGITAAKIRHNGQQDRWTWYVGYRFPDDFDEDVKIKIKELIRAYPNDEFHFNDNWAEDPSQDMGKMLWLKVFRLK